MNARLSVFAVLALAAALAPLARGGAAPKADGFPGWPTQFEGRALHQIAPAPEDAQFARDFPGRVARFSDGQRQIIVRWVDRPTRRLHPAAQCFAGAGYETEPAPMRKTKNGEMQGCFDAERPGVRLRVCEVIRGPGEKSWPDVSSWYWSAAFAPDVQGWWSFVVVENAPAG